MSLSLSKVPVILLILAKHEISPKIWISSQISNVYKIRPTEDELLDADEPNIHFLEICEAPDVVRSLIRLYHAKGTYLRSCVSSRQ